MTPREYARKLGVSTSTVYRRIKRGIIKAVKVGRFWKISLDSGKKPKPEKTQARKPTGGQNMSNRSTGFYGSGTPQVVIYGPEGKPFATSTSPWVQRNNQPKHYNLPIPEGKSFDWCAALTLHPRMTFWAIVCDYKGPEKYDPDDLSEAPEELRELIGRCRPHYYRRAILSTARKVEVKVGEATEL